MSDDTKITFDETMKTIIKDVSPLFSMFIDTSIKPDQIENNNQEAIEQDEVNNDNI